MQKKHGFYDQFFSFRYSKIINCPAKIILNQGTLEVFQKKCDLLNIYE